MNKINETMKKQLLLMISAFGFSALSYAQVHFSENFTGGIGAWTLVDADGDGNNWGVNDYNDGQGNVATSASWANNVILFPNNWMISPAINLTGVTGPVVLEWKVKAQDQAWANERYSVYANSSNNHTTMQAAGHEFTEVIGTTPSGSYVLRSVDLSAFAGQTIHIAFRHHDVSDMFRINIDDIMVRTPLANDAQLNTVTLARYGTTNTNYTLALNVTNMGSNPITSLSVDWNDGTPHLETINVNIAPGASQNVNHPTAVNYATAVERTINVSITGMNGGADDNMANNNGQTLFNTVSSLVTKRVLFEEGTGTWCGWCPRGKVAMGHMYDNYPNFIGIMVHNGDPMAVSAYDNAANFSGYPSVNVDRALLNQSVTQNGFVTMFNSRSSLIVPAAMNATVSLSGNQATIQASAQFVTAFASSNYRLAVIVTEDGVTGTTAGYNQSNFYAGGGNGPMGGYESLPNPVPAAQMVYDWVGRALLGGYAGQAGSVPATITDGQVVTHTFNYTIPTTQNQANLYGVVVLIDQSNGQIVNSLRFPIDASASLTEEVKGMDVNVYPNPATEVINVAFEAENTAYSLNLTDVNGRVIFEKEYTNLSGEQKLTIPVSGLPAGNYFINLGREGMTSTRQVIVK
jgi:hypothetical protein